ncbi:MAG: glycosyltransferase family 61 protein [Spirulinaceae cyanobacterium]
MTLKKRQSIFGKDSTVKGKQRIYNSLVDTVGLEKFSLLPKYIKRKLKKFLVSLARENSFFHLFGLVACKSYIQINPSNVAKNLPESDLITVKTILEQNDKPTKAAIYLQEQKIAAIQPITPQTETVILEIKNCNFSLRNNHLLDGKMNVLDEAGMQFERMPVREKFLSKPQKISGTVAYLTNVDPLNYYHWLCRTLPLLRLYKKFFDFSQIEFFYIGEFPLANFHRESLIRAGIRENQILQKACTAEKIVAAISSRAKYFGSAPINQENYLFSRSLFKEEIKLGKQQTPKRIYVQRGKVKRRKVVNEKKVISLLASYGFQPVTMESKTIKEQAEIFAQAEAIIAPHGAALTNLLFIQPGTKVIELLPYGYTNNCYYVMTDYGGGQYFYLQGKSINQDSQQMHNLDISLDIAQLKQICQLAFS